MDGRVQAEGASQEAQETEMRLDRVILDEEHISAEGVTYSSGDF